MESRSVRVFISSTFRDFGEERDLLVRQVFPTLRAKLKNRFVELVDVDLRWGITVEQAERGEVLPICLAEIDRSRPYFIGLLGERYGWIPEKDKYPSTLLRHRRWLKEHQGGKSITELEILHGVLNAPEMAGRARFYFRSSEYAQKMRGEYLPASKEDRQRQQALKARIRTSPFPVVRYATPVDLARRLEEDLWQILDEEFPAESVPDTFEQESLRHEAYAAPRRRLYTGGDGYLKSLKRILKKNTSRLLVTGKSGCGKSALLANASVGMHSTKVRVFEHYLGASSDSADPVALVRRIIEYIRRVSESTESIPNDPQVLLDSLPMWFSIASAHAQKTRTRWVFVLDALNSLVSHEDLRWLPKYLPARISLAISCLDGPVLEALHAKGPWECIKIEPLDPAGQERLLTEYLRRYNKTLPADLKVQALNHPLAGNPLWLKTLAEELRLFGSYEELEKRLTVLLGPPKGKNPNEAPAVDDIFEHVLERIDRDHGKKLVRNALTAIWPSRAGLSEPELLEIVDCPPALWAPIRYTLDEMLLESGGRITFAHDYLRTAVRSRYLPSIPLQRRAHRSLAKYFSSRPVDSRVAEELPHQWREAKAWSELVRTLTTLDIFEAMDSFVLPEEHLEYWLSIEAERKKPLLEPSMRKAWSSWALPENESHTGEVASALEDFLSHAGRGLAGSFISSLARKALAITEKTLGHEHPDTGARLNDLAHILFLKGDYAAAELLFRRALAITEKALGAEHPDTGTRLNNLALNLRDTGNYAAAEPLLRRALAIAEKSLGPEHPTTATCLNNLALNLHDTGDYAAAEQLLRRALTIAEKSLGPEHPDTGTRLNNLAGMLTEKGDYAAAEPLYQRALAIAEKSLGPEHPTTATCLNNLAGILGDKGDYAAAEPLLRRALAIAEKALGPDHPNTILALENLTYIREQLDE